MNAPAIFTGGFIAGLAVTLALYYTAPKPALTCPHEQPDRLISSSQYDDHIICHYAVAGTASVIRSRTWSKSPRSR